MLAGSASRASGGYRYTFTKKSDPQCLQKEFEMEKKAKLNFQKDGPIGLTGEVEIVDASGNVLITQGKTSFCRCGASGNKPYCDGTHAKIGFKAPADLGDSQKP